VTAVQHFVEKEMMTEPDGSSKIANYTLLHMCLNYEGSVYKAERLFDLIHYLLTEITMSKASQLTIPTALESPERNHCLSMIDVDSSRSG
jgi:hypothetical protein